MTIGEVARLTNLAGREGVWREFMSLADAGNADPYASLAALSGVALTAAEVKDALKNDAILQAREVLATRRTNGKLGGLGISALIVALPLIIFAQFRPQLADKTVIAAAKDLAPYQQIAKGDLKEIKTKQAKADAYQNPADIVGRYSKSAIKANAVLGRSDLSSGRRDLAWHGRQMVSLKVMPLPKDFVPSFPQEVRLAAVTPDGSARPGFPMTVIVFDAGDGIPSLIRAVVTDAQWNAIQKIGKGDLAVSILLP